jgi:nucleoside-diphosphate-sugar epimerase
MISVWGTGKATREFVYAGDVANAIISSIDKVFHPDPINIGSGEEISMSQLIKLLIQLCDKPMTIKYDTSKPDGQLRRLISSERAYNYFGYKSSVSLEDGLRKTIEWYKGNNGNN